MSDTTTLTPMAPTNSPTAPGNSTIGMNASTVVAVELSSGNHSRRSVAATAGITGSPRARRARIASVTTMALSTSRPSATISPVTDIW